MFSLMSQFDFAIFSSHCFPVYLSIRVSIWNKNQTHPQRILTQRPVRCDASFDHFQPNRLNPRRSPSYFHEENYGFSSIHLDKCTPFEPKTVVFYIGNPPKMVSMQVAELLYTNSSPMIPIMCVPYQPV